MCLLYVILLYRYILFCMQSYSSKGCVFIQSPCRIVYFYCFPYKEIKAEKQPYSDHQINKNCATEIHLGNYNKEDQWRCSSVFYRLGDYFEGELFAADVVPRISICDLTGLLRTITERRFYTIRISCRNSAIRFSIISFHINFFGK